MAHIDNLIAAIKDPQLREALHAEYDKVTKTRQFGLVFDRHQPESVLLPALACRAGDKVQVLREDTQDRTAVDGTGIWTTNFINRRTGKAQLRDTDGNTRNEPLDRLVATREFGDPIYPGLRSTGRVTRGGGRDFDPGEKPFHAIINAENYHALEALLYPYEGRVDAIYIDPPYNTGARDWKYNNDYVDDNDPYRHSKWLSFMEKRLQLAKRLLKPDDAVLIVTIDEKEVHRLGLLLEQTFPRARAQLVTIVINAPGQSRKQELARVDEYAFILFLGSAQPFPGIDDMLNEKPSGNPDNVRWESLLRSGTNSRRADRPALFYPVFIDPNNKRIVEVGESKSLTAVRDEWVTPANTVPVWPIKSNGTEGNWRASPEYLRRLAASGHVKLGEYRPDVGKGTVWYLGKSALGKIKTGEIEVTGRDEQGAVIVRPRATGEQGRRSVPKTVWNRPSHHAGWHGSALVRALLPERNFPFPKSLYAVEDALRVAVGDKPSALVLDFFGGSGTTAHAVARLNHQDGGRRRSIVVTNNEVSVDEARKLRQQGHLPGDTEWEALGIAEHITIPRITAALTGQTPAGEPIKGAYRFTDEFPMSDGLAENVEFFELTYEDPALVSLGRRFEAIAPLLWLKAGAQGTRIDTIDDRGWSLPLNAAYGVLFDTSMWARFVEEVAARGSFALPLTHLFVVTDSLVEFQQVVSRLDQSLQITRLYSDYLRSFEINTSR